MESITKEETYLQERWQTQKEYYSKQSAQNKRLHQRVQLFITIAAIAVPILLSIPEVPKLFPTILSGLIAAAAALERVESLLSEETMRYFPEEASKAQAPK